MKHPDEIRREIRGGRYTLPTAGLAPGYVQANLVILRKAYAFDFLLFCQRNPKPCPVLEVLEPGAYLTQSLANCADIRTDIPKYCLYEKGVLVDTVESVKDFWRDDFVTFLLGCSFSFENEFLCHLNYLFFLPVLLAAMCPTFLPGGVDRFTVVAFPA